MWLRILIKQHCAPSWKYNDSYLIVNKSFEVFSWILEIVTKTNEGESFFRGMNYKKMLEMVASSSLFKEFVYCVTKL